MPSAQRRAKESPAKRIVRVAVARCSALRGQWTGSQSGHSYSSRESTQRPTHRLTDLDRERAVLSRGHKGSGERKWAGHRGAFDGAAIGGAGAGQVRGSPGSNSLRRRHSETAASPSSRTLAGRSTPSSSSQFWNAPTPITVNLRHSLNITWRRPVSVKQKSPIRRRVPGNFRTRSARQPWNAPAPIPTRVVPSKSTRRIPQFAKHLSPIAKRADGHHTARRFRHPQKAPAGRDTRDFMWRGSTSQMHCPCSHSMGQERTSQCTSSRMN
jgi:hypothetical protein